MSESVPTDQSNIKDERLADKEEQKEVDLKKFPATASGVIDAYPGLNNQDLQNGIPVGLAFGSIPFLLKSNLSYSQIGVFSLATYPYSLKLLWSPIVDAIYSKQVGRRKSWIIPIQILTGCLFFWLGNHIDKMLEEKPDVYTLTMLFFTLIFFSATQGSKNIAVDGWALTLLSKNSLSYASSAQTIGLNTGYFLSFTVFLAFNSAEFSNKYFRSEPSVESILTLGSYLSFWSVAYFAVTLWLIFVKKEDSSYSDDEMDIATVYKTIWDICKMPHLRKFIAVLLVSKIGFIANEAVTGLKLLEKGFSKEDLALAVLIDFPFQIVFGYYAAKWSNGSEPLKPWIYAFYGRLIFAIVGMLVVLMFPSDNEISVGFFLFVILSTHGSICQHFGIHGINCRSYDWWDIHDSTFSNLGGTWPRFFVLEAVDYFTEAVCYNKSNPQNTLPPKAWKLKK
ncbi:2688_t:CDS:10 [Cetraspora pellucida]|uniref:2688_t:CDS:1 n=1 Tax=Cetraspora pellucida TaxID=1433469 RepID=A0A9N9NNP4_9GLOM|nr:2688_t:CDS:10 [Cetraspora pellucida]